MGIPPILCVAGDSGSGKTSLLERLVSALLPRGVQAGVVKRCGGGLLPGPAEKDSSRLAAAGARPSIAVARGDLIVQAAPGPMELLDLAAAFCTGCDLVLAEGFKRSSYDKVLVLPPGGTNAPPEDLEAVRLVVADEADPSARTLRRDDVESLAAWVGDWLDRRRRRGRDVIGAILVGGLSRRMGTDKAALRFRDRFVLEHLVEILGGRVAEVWTIGRPPSGPDLPRCVGWHLDLRAGRGPLGGIATALRVAAAQGAGAALVLACDMPAMSGEVLDLLLEQRRPDRPASVLHNPRTGRLEPLAALYEAHALEAIERALDRGALSATDLLESVGAHVIEAPPELAGDLANVNTPQELREIKPGR